MGITSNPNLDSAVATAASGGGGGDAIL